MRRTQNEVVTVLLINVLWVEIIWNKYTFNERNTYDIKLSSELNSAAHQLLKTLDISKSTTETHTHTLHTHTTHTHTHKSALCTDTPYNFTHGSIWLNTLSSNAHGLQGSNIGNIKVFRLKQFVCIQIRLHFTSLHFPATTHTISEQSVLSPRPCRTTGASCPAIFPTIKFVAASRCCFNNTKHHILKHWTIPLNNNLIVIEKLYIIYFTMWFEFVSFLPNISRTFWATDILPIRHTNTHLYVFSSKPSMYFAMTTEYHIITTCTCIIFHGKVIDVAAERNKHHELLSH